MVALVGNDNALKDGSHVFAHQTLADKEGFRNVSKTWYNQTISYEDGIAQMIKDRKETIDITSSLEHFYPILNEDDSLAIVSDETQKRYQLTEHVINQFSLKAGIRGGYLQQLFAREGSKKLLWQIMDHEWSRLNEEKGKEYFFRTNGDTVRAFLSTNYKPIDNMWFIEVLQKAIPGGRFSHWRGNSDTIYGNVLIPDTIREEKDSDYGAMVSVANCEIGTRQINTLPSLFRAICMNGCIWGQIKGNRVRYKHIGERMGNLIQLEAEIIKNIHDQIPLAVSGIDKLIKTNEFESTVEPLLLMAAVAEDCKFNVSEARLVSQQYAHETKRDGSLFSIIDAITRAGQQLSNEQWVRFDEVGGVLVNYTKPKWDALLNRANTMPVDRVEKLLGLGTAI